MKSDFTNTILTTTCRSLSTRLDVQAGDNILVPLCGKSLDMLWLAERGFQVTGIEISELAVQDFFR